MNKAYFAKYHKMTLRDAALKINKIKQHNATQITYEIIAEYFCSEADIEKMFEQGSIIDMYDMYAYGACSVADTNNIWHCIKLTTGTKSILIYTSGTSYILYYSFI